MKKTWVLIGLIFASTFLVTNVSSVAADTSGSVLTCVFNTPTNKTYDTGHLTLNASIYYAFAYLNNNGASYSIDDQTPRAFTVKLLEPELGSMAIVEGELDGLVTLPALPDGAHKITVYMEGRNGFPSRPCTVEETVYFSVDTRTPKLSNISVQSQTYNQPDLPLNFTVNEPTSWIGYSLDNTANVTLSGNTTITPQAGSHSIIIYANDTAGNMAESGTINFSIQTNPPLDITFVAIGCVIFISACLVAYFSYRHLHKTVRPKLIHLTH